MIDKLHFPEPCIRDSKMEYEADDDKQWISKINEEVAEVIRAAYLGDGYELALELQDVITVCTSWQAALGFDFGGRQKVCAEVNEKNRRRGYLGE